MALFSLGGKTETLTSLKNRLKNDLSESSALDNEGSLIVASCGCSPPSAVLSTGAENNLPPLHLGFGRSENDLKSALAARVNISVDKVLVMELEEEVGFQPSSLPECPPKPAIFLKVPPTNSVLLLVQRIPDHFCDLHLIVRYILFYPQFQAGQLNPLLHRTLEVAKIMHPPSKERRASSGKEPQCGCNKFSKARTFGCTKHLMKPVCKFLGSSNPLKQTHQALSEWKKFRLDNRSLSCSRPLNVQESALKNLLNSMCDALGPNMKQLAPMTFLNLSLSGHESCKLGAKEKLWAGATLNCRSCLHCHKDHLDCRNGASLIFTLEEKDCKEHQFHVIYGFSPKNQCSTLLAHPAEGASEGRSGFGIPRTHGSILIANAGSIFHGSSSMDHLENPDRFFSVSWVLFQHAHVTSGATSSVVDFSPVNSGTSGATSSAEEAMSSAESFSSVNSGKKRGTEDSWKNQPAKKQTTGIPGPEGMTIKNRFLQGCQEASLELIRSYEGKLQELRELLDSERQEKANLEVRLTSARKECRQLKKKLKEYEK